MTKVPLITGCKAQLHLPQGTITNKYQSEIRTAAALPALKEYITEWSGWSNDTFDRVEWTAKGRALSRHYEHRTTIVKMIHGKSYPPASVSTIHKYSNIYSHGCSSCSQEYETDPHHVWRCAKRREHRKFLLGLAAKARTLHTHDTLIEIMIDEGCMAYLDGRSPNFDRFPHRSYRQLIRRQAEIGWNEFLKGSWSTEWSRLQDDHLIDINQRSNQLEGITWATTCLILAAFLANTR